MNTLSNHSPRELTPGGVSRKRQKIEDKISPTTTTPNKASEPAESASSSSNQLLAGYFAHEFLTNGTLFGERWDFDVELKKLNPSPSVQAEPLVEKRERYAEVANLLKTDGAQLLGVVNPTQLTMWLPR